MTTPEIVGIIIMVILLIPIALIFMSVPINMQNDLDGTEGWFQRKPKEKSEDKEY